MCEKIALYFVELDSKRLRAHCRNSLLNSIDTLIMK